MSEDEEEDESAKEEEDEVRSQFLKEVGKTYENSIRVPSSEGRSLLVLEPR